MKNQYILTIDQSTSGTKVLVINQKGEIIKKRSKEHRQYYPQPGWVEHDPNEIYRNTVELIKDIIQKENLNYEEIKGIAITNQRETALIWEKSSGKPVYPAIVWQCNRTKDMCEQLSTKKNKEIIKNKTGLPIDPYFSASKLKWIFDNIEGIKNKAEKGQIIAGTIDSWLIWNLTGKEIHATDYTNASRTLLFNIKELCWDEELLELFQIPKSILPQVKPSNAIYGYTDVEGILKKKIPIVGVIGDSQGALLGQKCFKKGMIKATYGTGTSILMNIGRELVLKNNLVTTIAWGIDNKINYAFEGIIRSSGDTLKWLKDNLELFNDFEEVESKITQLENNEGVYLVPAFSGLGFPYWDMAAKAAIIGISRKTDKRHFIRAAVESIAYQITDAIGLMEKESSIQLEELRADGGASNNSFLMQFQSDLLKTKISVSPISELSAMGAAYLCGLKLGIWKTFEELNELNKNYIVYEPQMDENEVKKNYLGWLNAVKKVLN